jgi:beta-glucosidase
MGVVIGREARSLGIDVVLQPFINIDRDITFVRAYNTFGEDQQRRMACQLLVS